MGRVFLALDPNIDRKIALKVLAPRAESGRREEEQLRQRFVLEARAAGKLSHPGIVGVYDADTDPETGHSYIAMEWVRGQSLEACIEESGPLDPARASAIGEQVATALDTAHRAGLIHRDIKPGNILLDESGQAKVSDFGVAKFGSLSHTVTGQLLGSPYYMSPEQIRNEPIDGRSDLFSLGVVLYQCVTGVVPFAGESLASIAYKIVEIDPRPPQSINPSLPLPLARVIRRALAKAPGDRFQTGEELARALRSGDPGEVEEDRPVSRARGTGTVLVSDRAPRTGALPQRATGRSGEPKAAAGKVERRARDRRAGTRARSIARRWTSWSTGVRLALAALAIAAASLLVLMLRSGELERRAQPEGEHPGTERSEPGSPAEDLQAGVSEAEQTPVPTGWATLEVLYNNRLKSASISIWIDGAESWARTVAGPRKFLKRVAGEDVRATLRVPEGGHTIRIRVRGSSGRVDAEKRTEAVFRRGQVRRLRAVLIPPNVLRLRWKE